MIRKKNKKPIQKPLVPRVKKTGSMPKHGISLLSAGSSLIQRSFPVSAILSTILKSKPAGAGSDIIPNRKKKDKKIKSDPNSIPYKKMGRREYRAFMVKKQKEIKRKEKRRVEKRLASGEKNKRSIYYEEAVTSHKQLQKVHQRSIGINWD